MVFVIDIGRQVEDRLRSSEAFQGDLDDVLYDFVWFQFELLKPHHEDVRVLLGQVLFAVYSEDLRKAIDRPLELLFRELRARGIIREDVDVPDLMLTFKTMELGLIGLWAMEGPPFVTTGRVLRFQMKIFSEGLRAGAAYEV